MEEEKSDAGSEREREGFTSFYGFEERRAAAFRSPSCVVDAIQWSDCVKLDVIYSDLTKDVFVSLPGAKGI